MGYICGDIVHKNEVIGAAGEVRGLIIVNRLVNWMRESH